MAESMMEKLKAAKEFADARKAETLKSEQEAAALESVKVEKEGKRSELSKEQDRVTAELVKAEITAAEAVDAVAQGEAFAAEQGADPEIQAVIDGAKAEAEQAKAAVEAFREEMEKIKAELVALEAEPAAPVENPFAELAEITPVPEPVVEAAPEQSPENRRALAQAELSKQFEEDERKNKEDSLMGIEALGLTPEQDRRVKDLLKTIVFQSGGEMSPQQIAGTLDSETKQLRDKLLDTTEKIRGGEKLEGLHAQQYAAYVASAEKVAKTNPKVDAISRVIDRYKLQSTVLYKANKEAQTANEAAYQGTKAA